MAASIRKMSSLRSFLRNIPSLGIYKRNPPCTSYCTESTKAERKSTVNFENVYEVDEEELEASESSLEEVSDGTIKPPKEHKSFATLFRESRFVQLGNLTNKTVAGRIIDVINDDLYIDFGGKFYCVCSRPSFESDRYTKGQRVKIQLHQFEMSSKFLGSEQHTTLLEADATLLGLFDAPRKTDNRFKKSTDNDETSNKQTEQKDTEDIEDSENDSAKSSPLDKVNL